ncbi:uncharacterized protein LOC143259622 isoform X2 [Megalopta genalis]|uniref:uncharacterized protein LOC143259622 isoform X2 n=1 Tax=Megalopta genalis TaxID=115081 RepID=UPI003FD43C84
MIVLDKTFYSLTRKLLILTGLWPFSSRILNVAMRATWLCLVFGFQVVQIALLQIGGVTIIHMIYFISFSCTTMIVYVKYIASGLLQHVLKNSLESLARWHSSTDQRELQIFEKFGNKQDRVVVIYLYIGVTTTIVCLLVLASPTLLDFIVPLNNSRSLHFILVIEFDSERDNHFYLVYGYLIACCVGGVILTTANDCTISILLNHHSAVYETISYRIEKAINQWLDPKTIAFQKDHRLHRTIGEMMDLYQRTQSDFDSIMRTVMIPYSVLIVLMTISLCTHMSQFVERVQSPADFDLTIINGLSYLIQLVTSYRENCMSQTYTDNSLNVFHELCKTRWYKLPLKVQKLLLLSLQRTSKGSVPLLAGIYVPSRKGFTGMLNASFKYFTMMNSIRYNS